MDVIVGQEQGRTHPTGEKMRQRHYGQMFQSHSCISFTWLHPICYSNESDPLKRNIIQVALQHQDAACREL
jgi:hypothetical protein